MSTTANVLPVDDFAVLRHKIWLRKTYGYNLPAEESEILDCHHYTNIWRELDRNSVYLFNNIQPRELSSLHHTTWNTILFRLFNKIETHEAIIERFGSLVDGFKDPVALYAFLSNRTANFTGAYVRCPDLTQLCYANSNEYLEPTVGAITEALLVGDAKAAWKGLRSIFSIGDFLADQLLMDLTWQGGAFDREIVPASKFFVPDLGPGAKAGLAYCSETGQGTWAELLPRINEKLQALLLPQVNGSPVLFDERALEHTLCEYFKHVKFQNRGDSTVKMRNYKPATGTKVDALPFSWTAPKGI